MRDYSYSTFLLILGFLYLINTKAQPNENRHDTVQAMVQYGNHFILEKSYYNRSDFIDVIDSLLLAENEKAPSYNLLKSVYAADNNERIIIIDSLFSLDNVPYDLINEIERISFYYKQTSIGIAMNISQDLTGNSPYPSHLIYDKWDNRAFKNSCGSEFDSSIIIQLTDNKERKFHHPVCHTTIKKYGGKVTSKQGWREGKRHNGVDINLDQWDSVLCAFDGKVRFAREYSGYGKVVVVRHYNGLESVYAHLARIKVNSDQEIKAGDLIGLAGSTGNSEGSHLHLEFRFRDHVLNPENIIDFTGFCLKSDSLLLKKTGKSYIAFPVNQQYHIIERGDYPLRICSRYGMDLDTFCEINNISSKTKLKAGDKVIIK